MEHELPPLPTSQFLVDVWDSQAQGKHQANAPYYTADQMREYARTAIAQAVRKECAVLLSALQMARAVLVDFEGYEVDGPTVQVIDAAIRARGKD